MSGITEIDYSSFSYNCIMKLIFKKKDKTQFQFTKNCTEIISKRPESMSDKQKSKVKTKEIHLDNDRMFFS